MRHWNLAGLTAGKPTAAGEPWYCTGMSVSTILGLPAWAERRLRLRNCLFRAWIIRKACGWRLAGLLNRRGHLTSGRPCIR